MTRSLKLLVAAGVTASTLAVGAGSASAAHCTDYGAPGNSAYAKYHVQATNGNGEHNEGLHQGWSSCVEQAQSGKNR